MLIDTATVSAIAKIIDDPYLARSIHHSIEVALATPGVHLHGGATPADVFHAALGTAVRDIADHPLGRLFQRFVRDGPLDGTEPADGKTERLTDAEVGTAVRFIHAHMVNRFKGELAELLALEPCLALLRAELGATAAELYWGETVEQRVRRRGAGASWGTFTKGADGLLVERAEDGALQVRGILEVKSMYVAPSRLRRQLDRHLQRLRGGVRLAGTVFEGSGVRIARDGVFRIVAMPSAWRVGRDWTLEDGTLSPPKPEPAPEVTMAEQLGERRWRIRLAWSREALEQAAYAMTFDYMAQVGDHVYSGGRLPRDWRSMTPKEAGRNAIKMMLYYALLRPLPESLGRISGPSSTTSTASAIRSVSTTRRCSGRRT